MAEETIKGNEAVENTPLNFVQHLVAVALKSGHN